MSLSKLKYSDDNFYFVTVTKTNGGKKIVKATKNDFNFNRYGFSLYRIKPRLPVSQIFVTATKSLFWVTMYLVEDNIFIDKKVTFLNLTQSFCVQDYNDEELVAFRNLHVSTISERLNSQDLFLSFFIEQKLHRTNDCEVTWVCYWRSSRDFDQNAFAVIETSQPCSSRSPLLFHWERISFIWEN